MSLVSNRSISVRIFVKDHNLQEMRFEYMRAERVAFPPSGIMPRKAFLHRTGEIVNLYVFLMDWKTYEVLPMFMANNSDVSLCLNHLRINCYDFE